MRWAGRPPDSRRDACATIQFPAMRTLRCGLIAFLFSLAAFAQDGQQQFASLGDFKLESGEAIRDCRLGYRTFGQLNSDKSNAILFPTCSVS